MLVHWWACLLLLGSALISSGALTPAKVLVLYNSKDPDSLAIWNHYAAVRPGVRGFDFNDATLVPGTISYANFISKIRQPLRTYLTSNSLQQQVVVFVLTKGLPHRVQDIQGGDVGDNPGSAATRITGGNASYASVDSELTLLWQNLETGEAGGNMDSGADNYVVNPYYSVNADITSYDRSTITATKFFSKQVSGPKWQLLDKSGGTAVTPGSIYLTARLDGNSAAAVNAMIDRGLHPVYDKSVDTIIEDKSAGGTFESGDYSSTQTLMAPTWPAFVFEQTDAFLIGLNGDLPAGNAGTQRFSGRVAALTGYGGNHSGGLKDGYINTYRGQLGQGAIYNAFESYNARKFGGVGGFDDHGQLSDWVDAGGTFGTGHVWEPLTTAVARNYLMLARYFNDGRTWVESAWSGMRYLSWQNVVLGDPLAVASFGSLPLAPPVASVSASGSMVEGSTSTMATATVTLSTPAAQDTVVHLAFAGTVAPGTDFSIVAPGSTDVVVPAFQTAGQIQMVAVKNDLPDGTRTVRMQVAGGSGYVAASGEADVPITDSPFGVWQASRFGANAPASRVAATADPDGDGLPNLVEYTLGLDPLHKDGAAAPAVSLAASSGGAIASGSSASYRFTHDTAAANVGWQVECSSDLKTWQAVPVSVIATSGGIETLEAHAPAGAGKACFFRIAVHETTAN
ncbi:hypothetical protein [Luteolibacter sp. LG18]|uniref:hypothetical protein n=1 Tax=Luteolibacter sp. LG18 TaxID=2819286 RepID=UPI002B2D1AEB|nr:hypothetical protein llg_08040 [Luteolibacter sp. LG18]